MRLVRRQYITLFFFLFVLIAACSPAAASTNTLENTTTLQVSLSATAAPTDKSMKETSAPTATEADLTIAATPSATDIAHKNTTTPSATGITPTNTATLTALPSPTACPPDLCAYSSQYFLERPIDSTNNDKVDITYRFGSTQAGKRDPHHGVEFLNGFGTPVLSAADGVVIVAGEDREAISEQGSWPIIFYGPYSYFYGNLVVIEHELPESLLLTFPGLPETAYTLYGHLSQISVEVGDQVEQGDKIGNVGMAGIAEGSHLHFEVRVGENTYENSRNPELWLRPHKDEDGQWMGGIAGRLIDSFENNIQLSSIVLEYLPDGHGQPSGMTISLMSYEEKGLIGQLPWEESFAVGDLPAGWYQITYPFHGLQEKLIRVFPGKLTMVTFHPDEEQGK